MKVTVSGKQLDLGDALQTHATETMTSSIGKYYDKAVDAQVVVRREAHLFHADLSVHVGTGIDAHATAEGDSAYAAFDAAVERLEKQLRRDKRKRRNHHAGAQRKLADAD